MDTPPAASLTQGASAWRTGAAAAGILALYLGLTCFHLGDVPLLDPDEPRYAGAGRTMAEGGSWLLPEFNGAERINKPPLFYWLVALSMRACGASEWSARLPSVLAGLAMLGLTAWTGARVYGWVTGLLGALILCTSPLFVALSRACVTDQTLSTLVAGGLCCVLLGLTGRWPFRRVPAPLAAGVFMGLALLAKGPPAVLVLLVPALFWLLFAPSRGCWTFWLRPAGLLGLAAAAVLGLWWFLWLRAEIGGERFQELLDFELRGRLAGQVHRQGWYYYLYIFPALFLPWSFGLPAALGGAWRRVADSLPLEPSSPETPSAPGQLRQVADPFLVAWVLGVVLFFTIPAAKLGSYILPAFPAAALLTARFLIRLPVPTEHVRHGWRNATAFLALGAMVLLVIVASGGLRLPERWQSILQKSPVPLSVLLGIVGAGACLPWFIGALTGWVKPAVAVLAFFVAGLTGVGLQLCLPAIQSASSKRLCEDAKVPACAHAARRIYTWGVEEGSLHYYLRREVHEIRKPDKDRGENVLQVLRETLAGEPPGGVVIFVNRKYFEDDSPLGFPLPPWGPPGSRVVLWSPRAVVLVNEPARR